MTHKRVRPSLILLCLLVGRVMFFSIDARGQSPHHFTWIHAQEAPEQGMPEQEELEVGVQDAEVSEELEITDSLEVENNSGDPPQDEPAGAGNEAQAPDKKAQQAPPADEVLKDEFEKAYVIEIEGVIFNRFDWYLRNRLQQAKKLGADLVVIWLTTPGGGAEHSVELGNFIAEIDWAKTVVYVPREAISGGAILSLGADRIYMREGAIIGDAGPIKMGAFGFEHAEEKYVSYLAKAVGSIADSKQRSSALAKAMVDRQLKVYEAVEIATGEKTYLTEVERKADEGVNKFQVGRQVPETGKNRFLTLDAERALELRFIEGVFDSNEDFLASLNAQETIKTEINWVDKTVFLLTRNWMSALLLIVGLVGVYLELVAPGISVAGLTGLVCFTLFFWSHFLGGTAGWLEVVLFMLGVVCLVCEIFVLPGFGVFGVSGLVLMGFSLVMASQDFLIPEGAAQWSVFQTNLLMVLGVMCGVVVLVFGQVLLLDSLPGLGRLQLQTPEAEVTPKAAATVRPTLSLGMKGVAESDLRPSGKVFFDTDLLDVVSEGDYVEAGSHVSIVRMEGNQIVVRKMGTNT